MHKKSVETPSGEEGCGSCSTPPPPSAEKGRAKEREKESAGKGMEFSCQELKENSIAALRAKAQEHSAMVLQRDQEEELNPNRK